MRDSTQGRASGYLGYARTPLGAAPVDDGIISSRTVIQVHDAAAGAAGARQDSFQGGSMSRWFTAVSTSVLLILISSGAHPHAERRGLTFAVTMTNDASANQIRVYDAESHDLLQTLSTGGTGGAGGEA